MVMATSTKVSLDCQFHLLKMDWAYLTSLIVPLFHLIYKIFFRRYEVDENRPCNLSEAAKSSEIFSTKPENNAVESGIVETEESEPDMVDAVSDLSDEVEPPPQQLLFSFKFPTFDEYARTQKDIGDSQILSAHKLVGEEEASTCHLEEFDADSKVCSFDCTESNQREIVDFVEEVDLIDEKIPDKFKLVEEEEEKEEEQEEEQELQVDEEPKSEFSVEQKKFDIFSCSDSDSMTSSPGLSVMSRLLDSTSDEEEEFEKAKEFDEEELGRKSQENGTENEESQLDDQWEHQDLIEQLKMELKRVKATGLPTIDENSESPKVIDDLKPWKIDEKSDRGAFISEIHKVYKSYKERMRKFDILNYQKMYALGLLKTKEPILTQNQSSSSYLTSILPPKLFLCNKKKNAKQDDPISKYIAELHGDLETVYVGQLCLSWEFLHWQYEKALDLWESDRFLVRCYNEVAGEFQQLQVVMNRFLENEEFEGPRVEYYVKSRCFLRNLLQVPVIREDHVKGGKRKGRVKGEFGVTSDVLVEIIEESIRVFWRFIRADKDASGSCRKGSHPELEDPADLDMFIGVQIALQKKEKKLKEVMKGGNCILKKLKKRYQEEEEEQGDGRNNTSSSSSDQVVAFFSQVDMKLVRRVLNMSRLSTDHLTWCSAKLSQINFMQRKIFVEPSFLLFPS